MAMANSVDCQLKRLRMLSLKDISLRRVATILLRDPVKYRFESTVEDERDGKREEQFESLVAELELPESIREPLVNIMHPIFQETFDFSTFHEQSLELCDSEFYSQEYTKHIRWTHIGTINYRKTAEAMIRDENLKIDRRFMLACLYCLEKDILDIWKELSEWGKREIFRNLLPCRCGQPREIIVIWMCLLELRVDDLSCVRNKVHRRHSSINQYAFETFANRGYETATQYFFEKLSRGEKDASLVRTANAFSANAAVSYGPRFNVYCYLLSQMNEEQVQNVLENSSYGILRIFLEWPGQDVLPEIAKLSLPYFKKDDCDSLHLYLFRKFKYAYNAAKLFQDLFVFIPKQYRRSEFYMDGFLQCKNTEIIRFMFRNMDPAETLELLLRPVTVRRCCKLVKEGEWEFLEFFIRESKLSESGRKRFAARFKLSFVLESELETLERFTKMMNDISTVTSNCDWSNRSKVDQADPMDSQPTGQQDGELIERPDKKNKRLKKQIIFNDNLFLYPAIFNTLE